VQGKKWGGYEGPGSWLGTSLEKKKEWGEKGGVFYIRECQQKGKQTRKSESHKGKHSARTIERGGGEIEGADMIMKGEG